MSLSFSGVEKASPTLKDSSVSHLSPLSSDHQSPNEQGSYSSSAAALKPSDVIELQKHVSPMVAKQHKHGICDESGDNPNTSEYSTMHVYSIGAVEPPNNGHIGVVQFYFSSNMLCTVHKKVHLFSVYIVCVGGGGDYVNWDNPCLLFFMHKSKYTFCAVFFFFLGGGGAGLTPCPL